MGSESLFIRCKACGKDISKSAKICPECGAKQRKLKPVYLVALVIFGLMIIGSINTQKDNTTTGGKNAVSTNSQLGVRSLNGLTPETQRQFVEVVNEHIAAFNKAKNELQQSVLRDQRKAAIGSALRGYQVDSWLGEISGLETNSEGKAILSVRISSDIQVKTWNNSISDIGSNTLIAKGTPVFDGLLNLSRGQSIKFSGSFFPSDIDFAKETSMTIGGSMRRPEFLFKFQSITPIN